MFLLRSSRILGAVVASFLLVAVAPAFAGELRDPLPDVLDRADPDELVPVSVVMARQVSREEVASIASGAADPEARRRAIRSRLQQEADLGQREILRVLDGAEFQGRAADIRRLWISSVVGVRLTPDLVRTIAARPDVSHVNWNPERDVFLGSRESRLGPGSAEIAASLLDATAEIECGVDLMRAPEVWNDFGVTGEGAVIAVIDTGVCWTHPDIANQIWVNPGEDLDEDGAVMDPDDQNGVDDDGNGFIDDLIGWNFDNGNNQPNDTNSHGSHCAGTVAGDGTSGTQAGMAPDAKIMVVRVGVNFSDEVDVWNGMQYAAANGANAISMSLGWPHNQNPDRATWRQNAENTIDMGTAMVIAAGNEGAGNEPDNVRTPGDVPRVITVGATDCADEIASFSSRGPVTWTGVDPWNDWPYPPGLVKPDISAPGVNTKSHNICSGYSLKSGTSMATPHTAGAVALMVSANPSLTHDEIKEVLEQTSIDLGQAGKDNVFGSGRVDAYEAVANVAGKVVYDSHVVSDSDPDYGNGDGDIDQDEIVTVQVDLFNKGDSPATGVWATLSSSDPNVEVIDGTAYYPDIAIGATASSAPPHFTIRLRSGCGQNARFRLEARHDGGSTSFSGFNVRTGFRVDDVFLQDDMETEAGWTPSGTEVEGAFEWGDPHEVVNNGTVIQPEDDATPGAGVACWTTGNPRPKGNFDPGSADVDNVAYLTSPVFDAAGGDNLTVEMSRWFYLGPVGSFETSHYELQISNDAGATWVAMERLESAAAGWAQIALPVGVPATSQMQLRVKATEERSFGGLGDNLVEAAVDDFRVFGWRYVCDAFVPPAAQAPNEVGPSLLLEPLGESVQFDWIEPGTDATHDAATMYRIYRSTSPDAGFGWAGTTTAPHHVESGEMEEPDDGYFLVVSENGGGTSGDEPTP